MKWTIAFLCVLLATSGFSQYVVTPEAQHWVDSVFKSLSDDQRITQLMVLRESSITKGGAVIYDQQITDAIKKYNIGGICVFQGSPVKQANFLNYFQSIAKTPLMVCIDAEWGLGMRWDSIIPLNHQLMLGAVQDPSIVYNYGKLIAMQCKRAGIQVDYAPVVDINNNPDNPVINDRSFGEDKYKVASYGIQYMKGLQDNGVLATAKHFPGHGDVSVDSHLDLPVINKSRQQLDSLELYPFRQIFDAGVGSVMVAHLYIPSIDASANTATSLSKKNVTGLLRNELKYQGLTFTDALGMQGVAKFFPGGDIGAQSLIAGNDMLCLPVNVDATMLKIKEAIINNKLTWEDIYAKCKKVLLVKYLYGLSNLKPVNTSNLTADLNAGTDSLKKVISENAITVLDKTDAVFYPLTPAPHNDHKEVAYIGVGINADNAFAKRMRSDYNADVFYFDYKQDLLRLVSLIPLLKTRYKQIIIGVHNYGRYPAHNFNMSDASTSLIKQLQQRDGVITFVFGNPYAIRNFCSAKNLIACYEDDNITQIAAVDFLEGKIGASGKLPVTVCNEYKYGTGIVVSANSLPLADPKSLGMEVSKFQAIDSIANDAIEKGSTPGCVLLVAKDGKVAYQKAYGYYDWNKAEKVNLQTIYDMASVTKICATTLCVMKLYDEKKLALNKTLGDYLPWVKGTNKEGLVIENILLHQAGLVAYIPFYKETIDSISKLPRASLYTNKKKDSFSVRVAENLYLRNDWQDTIWSKILHSPLGPPNKYIYSDNDFIFLGKIVEGITGESLDKYVKRTFYDPLGLTSTGFKPLERFSPDRIAPTENEPYFRFQHLRGDVHDPGAAMFGGVAGHAGLFSNVHDLAIIMQMLLNGGIYNGKRFINNETIDLFTSYNSSISRRGLGFDKPEKDNYSRHEPYPAKSVSSLTFGHTGFTGTCVWADPRYNLVFVFLSNRVNVPAADQNKLLKLNVRGKIQDAIYKAMSGIKE